MPAQIPSNAKSFTIQFSALTNLFPARQLRSAAHPLPSAVRRLPVGGGGGIRTPDPVSGITVFKTVAIDHSATPPARPWPGRLAGREGLEPPTDGFGDRYSTN